jgi:serine acetyltransferase
MRRVTQLLHWPLLAVAVRCSMTEMVRRDLLRVQHLDPNNRASHNRASREELLKALLMREARTVFYYRLRFGTIVEKALSVLLRLVYPGQVGVEILCEHIGAGFALGHGQASVIWAASIGEDCTIYQHCTIGLKDGQWSSPPVLGDRVWVWPGGKVIGVTLGDDSTVGAGAVVLHDVPANRTAVGIPARLR